MAADGAPTLPTDVDEFRAAVRSFVAEHGHPMRGEGLRVPVDDAEERAIRTWLASLYEAGFLGGGWPVEWGGQADHHPRRDLVVMEELILGDAYRPLDQVMLASHALLSFGSDAQKAELLPRIRRGEHVWCQLFSEPDAGSDLAALRTRAVRDGDGWKVTGQKIWSTDAQWADMGTLLARTDPDVDRHAGITAFIIPMDLPGIEIRPIREMTGHAEFCEVFLDEVPVGPEHVLGAVDDGWRVVTSGLASERAFVGANAIQLQRLFDDLVALARTVRLADGSAAIDHEDMRADLARALVRVEGVKAIVTDTVERILDDAEQASDGPVAKLAYTELDVALTEQALALLSSAASVDDAGVAVAERWYHNFLWSRALTISGGSSEIMRGLIGRQLLGLPRA
jgi:alkylation response protein AidB-like acyl-CoA dehydrogenase